jgi:hypothetical protein
VHPRDGVVAADGMKQLHGIESGLGDMSLTVRGHPCGSAESTGGPTSAETSPHQPVPQGWRTAFPRPLIPRPGNALSQIRSDGREVGAISQCWHETALESLVDNFAGFASSRIERQRE